MVKSKKKQNSFANISQGAIEEDDDDDQYRAEEDAEHMGDYEYKVVATNKSENFQCMMNTLDFELVVNEGTVGHIIRLEQIHDKQNQNQKVNKFVKQTTF